MRILVVSTAVGPIGQGRGGGVEVTIGSLVRGLVDRGHQLMVLAPEGSEPCGCPIRTVAGQLQPPWQQQSRDAPIVQPPDGVLANLWREAWALQGRHHVVLNLGYDWLPLWLGPCFTPPVLHLISMGSLSQAMDQAIADVARTHHGHLAFHSRSQMESFGIHHGLVVGNGFDLGTYRFVQEPEPLLGWVGRIAPEKGLEDAAAAATALHLPLAVVGPCGEPCLQGPGDGRPSRLSFPLARISAPLAVAPGAGALRRATHDPPLAGSFWQRGGGGHGLRLCPWWPIDGVAPGKPLTMA